MKAIRHIFEYIGLRLALFLCDHLPFRATSSFFSGLAGLWFVISFNRRRIAVDNILQSGITSDPHEASRIARDSFKHFAILVLESLKSDTELSGDDWKDKVEIDIAPETMKMLNDPNGGMIIVSGHIGNWEIAAQLLSRMKPVVAITRDLNNPYVNKVMKARKSRNDVTLTPKHDANSVRFLSAIKQSKVLALLTDQHAINGGTMINFLGRPASTHTSPALLHLVTKAPLCFGYCIRKGPMDYKLVAHEPIRVTPTGDRKKDVQTILENINTELETIIRQYPEQYLWAHRRWKA
jgi:KDO2-lipid IV(A) lauroyltransferase